MALNIAAINSNTPPISGIFHFKIRDDIIPGIHSLVNASGRCEDPEISLSYDQDGNLTWVVRKAVTASLNSWFGCEPCRLFLYSHDQVDSIDINLVNNEASGYLGKNIYGCPYSISAHNYCCGTSSGCYLPYVCMDGEIKYYYDEIVYPPGTCNIPSNVSGFLLCASVSFLGNNGTANINGLSIDEGVTCLELSLGSSLERYYNLTAINDCGIVSFQSFETMCCDRKDSAIVEIDGLESFDLHCVDNWTEECDTEGVASCHNTGFGTVEEHFTCNFADINGTYIVPVDYIHPYFYIATGEECRGCKEPCQSETVNTGIRININYKQVDTASMTSVCNFPADFFNPARTETTTTSQSYSDEYIMSADLAVNAYGFSFVNIILRYIYNYTNQYGDHFYGDTTHTTECGGPATGFKGLNLFGNLCNNSQGPRNTNYIMREIFGLVKVNEVGGNIILTAGEGGVLYGSPHISCTSPLIETHTDTHYCSPRLWNETEVVRNYYSNVTWI